MKINVGGVDMEIVAAYLRDRNKTTIAEISSDALGNKFEKGAKSIPKMPGIIKALRHFGWKQGGTTSNKYWER